MISIDIYWHLLTSIDIYWHLLTSIDIFVPEHGGDPPSSGKSRPGLGWSVLDVMKALEVERAANMDGLWFTLFHTMAYH